MYVSNTAGVKDTYLQVHIYHILYKTPFFVKSRYVQIYKTQFNITRCVTKVNTLNLHLKFFILEIYNFLISHTNEMVQSQNGFKTQMQKKKKKK